MTVLSPRGPAPREHVHPPRTRAERTSGWFRAFWRWHFYASTIVVPVLTVLAVTGLVYLFRFEIEPRLHADLMRVEQPAGVDFTQPYAAQQTAVQRAYPDATIASLTEPATADESTRFSVTTADGAVRDVFVDPWTTEVLGSLDPDRTLSGYAVRLHADLMSGRAGDLVVELGVCWAIVMAITGYVLAVRGRRARRAAARSARASDRQRVRNRVRRWHVAVGAVTGFGVLAMVVTGLPWTGVWGAQVQRLASDRGTSLWSTDPGATSAPTSRLDESLPHTHDVPWAQGATEVPSSTGQGDAVADVDTAVAVADREGLRHPYTVALPAADDGVYSVMGYAFDDPTDERTLHVDRFDGEVVSAYGYEDYPLLAKAVSQGIGLHEGRSLGTVNFWASAAFCVAVLAMCVTGPLMWWRRRPAVTNGSGTRAPRGRLPVRATPWLAALLVALGVALPVFGVSLVVVLVLDQLVLRRVPALGRWFGVTG